MQKKSFIIGGSALVALSLFAAAPAQAADTVTTSDVAPTAWTQVLNPYTSLAPADLNFFSDYDLTSEPLVFPFTTPDTVVPIEEVAFTPGFDLAWLAPAPAAECTRVVNGFTLSITNAAGVEGIAGVAIGSSSDELGSIDPGTVIEPGVPAGAPFEGLTSGIVAPSATQSFTATLEAPIAWSSDISAVLALQASTTVPHSWTINSVTFNVTDTCAEAVIVPAEVVTPAAPVVQPALANTGVDFAPMGFTAGALLLGGIAAVGAVSATRRIRSTRP